jgi:hypothetical protein
VYSGNGELFIIKSRSTSIGYDGEDGEKWTMTFHQDVRWRWLQTSPLPKPILLLSHEAEHCNIFLSCNSHDTISLLIAGADPALQQG